MTSYDVTLGGDRESRQDLQLHAQKGKTGYDKDELVHWVVWKEQSMIQVLKQSMIHTLQGRLYYI